LGRIRIMAAFDVLQAVTGAGVTSIPTPSPGNLLVVAQAHRQDLRAPNSPGPGFVQRVIQQFKTTSNNRNGIVVWDKVADGSETSVNFAWGTSSDLGGFYVEYEAPPGGWEVAGTDTNTSGASILSALTVPIPVPSSSLSLAVAAVVGRGVTGFSFNNDFVQPSSRSQTALASRKDAASVPNNEVTATFSGNIDESSIVSAVYFGADTPQPTGKLFRGPLGGVLYTAAGKVMRWRTPPPVVTLTPGPGYIDVDA
jgi:hypothetical protein